MKYFVTILFFLLVGCEQLSKEERALVGKWEWKENEDGLGLSGYLILNEDRTYSYELNWSAKLHWLTGSFSYPHRATKWSLEDGAICVYGLDGSSKNCWWIYEIDSSEKLFVPSSKDGIPGPVLATTIEANRVEK
ncbi:MAG: hypothetical protein O7D86_01260 [Proteobacteria bacterium]|nr:hypothetical protein [Pseudomonadota bacterium]